ncbi:MAG: TMEM175 family protein [Enterococcus sp.]
MPKKRTRNREQKRAQMNEFQQNFQELTKDSPSKLKEHLELFNDAVIAIIITIMVLEVPLPIGEEGTYSEFLRALSVFFISFFIVANFWYQHHRSFALLKEAKKKVLILNFLFLAVLATLPLMTKWVMQDPSSLAVLNYGVVYFLISAIQLGFTHQTYKALFADYINEELINLRTWFGIVGIFLLNLLLIAFSQFHAILAMWLYLSLPLISFFMPELQPEKRKSR